MTAGNVFRKLYSTGPRRILARGAVGSFGVKVAGAGLALLVQVTFTRLLGVEEYGRYIYVLFWMHAVALLGVAGFTTASVRYVADYAGKGQWGLLRGYMRYSRRVVSWASLGAALLLLGGAGGVLGRTGDEGLLRVFGLAALALPLLTWVQWQSAVLRGLKQIVKGLVPLEVLRAGLLLVGLLAGVLWMGVPARATTAMGLQVGGLALCGLVAYGWLRRGVPPPVRQARPEVQPRVWLQAALAMLLIDGFNVLLFQLDTLMVGTLVGTTEAGLYAVVSKVASLLAFLLVAVNTVLAPLASELYSRGERDELQRVVRLGASMVALAASIGAVGLLVWDREILGLFGEAFTEGTPVLWILVGGQLVNALAGPAILLLNMTNNQNVSARILGLSGVLNLILNGILIPWWGLTGAATATAITMFFWNVSGAVMVWRRLNLVSIALPPRLWKSL